MFRQRTSAQKPGDDLLADFRQQFPEVSTVNTESSAPAISQTTTAAELPTLSAPVQENTRHVDNVFPDLDPTPRASNDPWRFTPSLLDPTAFSFSNFASNNAPGYYTPTPGGTGTLLPPQIAGLHPPPSLAMTTGLETPLSLPTTADAIHPSVEIPAMAGLQALDPHQIHHFNTFVQAPPSAQPPPFMASSFAHDTGYETMEHDGFPMDSDPSEERIPTIASTLHPQQVTRLPMIHSLPAAAEKFRFHATLNAPTAMVKHADEIPVTYLNKGQAYSLSIVDMSGTVPIIPGARYRTFVRVSFEDDQQRQKPGVCWSLWKEGRGINEAHHRGGKLLAVEYVVANPPPEGDDKRTRVELESCSFDGFSVVWTPGVNGAPEVSIAVRFNFLSTDFSHSKGVKGIPVRLCAKTNLVPLDPTRPAPEVAPEICFCKVKLFRDHGAERKLSNDIAHVKKSIDKLKQQIAQAESGSKDGGKRKRAGGFAKGADAHRPGKVQKHKRTWSMSSTSSAGGGGTRVTLEEDLHFKLQTLQDMFTSTRPVSVLYLRGDELDDPDLHPVSLQGDTPAEVVVREGANWQPRSTRSSVAGSLVSPSPSSLSLASQSSAIGSGAQWQSFDSAGSVAAAAAAAAAAADGSRKKPDQPTAIGKSEDDGTLSCWIEALDVDPSYQPPPEQCPKPVACFYVVHSGKTEAGKREYHRAIYLSARTLKDLNRQIAAKWGLEASHIVRTIHVAKAGVEVEMDDEVVQALKEGQDMQLEIEEVVEQGPTTTKGEWEMSVDEVDGSEEVPAPAATRLVLRLAF